MFMVKNIIKLGQNKCINFILGSKKKIIHAWSKELGIVFF